MNARVPVTVAVDVGTSLVKAVRYDADGAEDRVARRRTTVARRRPGWAEQDPREVWDAVVEVVREVVREGERPALLAVTAQGDGAWLVDAGGEPTGAAVLWNDGRAARVLDRWSRDGVLTRAFAVNGSRTSTGMPNAVLAWMQREDPERLTGAAHLLTAGGLVFHRMTGRAVVDESDASAPFLDIRARDWSEELLDLYGLARWRHLLPDLGRGDDLVGRLEGAAADALGLAAGLPVVLAPYDVCSTAIGAGAAGVGSGSCILGTTLATQVVVDRVAEPAVGDEGTGVTISFGVHDRWLRLFPTMAGCDVLDWVSDLLAVPSAGDLLELAAAGQPGTAGVRFLPYLSPAGERAPFFDPRARGSLTGLSFAAGRADVARSVVEGLTLSIRDCLEAATPGPGERPTSLTVCGGGSASDWWTGLIADACALPVHRLHDREVGARGAMVTALVATGHDPDLETAAERLVRRHPAVEPSSDEGWWDERHATHLALREQLSSTWPTVSG